MIIPIIKTAPSEFPSYEETNLLDKCEWYLRPARVNDIKRSTFPGYRRTTKRSIQRIVTLNCSGLDPTDAALLQKWKHDRTRVRPQGFYGEKTVLHQSFQRSKTDAFDVGSQIYIAPPSSYDPSPTFVRGSSVTGSGQVLATFMAEDGYMYTVDDDVPRYQAGAFGLRGLLSESTQTNRVHNNYASSGSHLWVTHAGSPTIAFKRDDKPLVANAAITQSTHVTLTPSDQVKFEITAAQAGTTVDQIVTVWVKGQGSVFLSVYENTPAPALLGSSGVLALDGTWQKVEKLFTRSSGAYDLRVILWAVSAGGNECHIGPVQIEDGWTPTSFIYNWGSAGSTATRNVDALLYDIELPYREGTIFVAFKMPPIPAEVANKWLFHRKQNATPDRFGLWLSPTTPSFTFRKFTSAGTWDAFYTSSKTEGDDVLIAIAYDYTDIRIYEDGVKQYTRTPYSTLEQAVVNGLYLSDAETNFAAIDEAISFIRIDRKKMTDAEILAASNAWINDDEHLWQLFFEGRDFEIESMTLRINEGDTEDFLGAVTLAEVESEPTATTEAP